MSNENVEAFRRAVDAYNRRDLDAFLEHFDRGVEWRPLTQVMFGRESSVYRGHEGIHKFWREVEEAFAEAQMEILEIRPIEDGVVASGRLHARGRASGAPIEGPIGWVVRFEDGRVVRMTDYPHPRDALEAAGLNG